jgi:hypothetical protein
MENLADIPLRDDIKLSDRESNALREYFGESSGDGQGYRLTWTEALKASGYGVLLFAVLANPWINALLYKIPQMSNNPILAFCAKLFIFAFAMLLISKLAV